MAQAVEGGGAPPARDDWKNEKSDDDKGGAKAFENELNGAGKPDPARGEDPDWERGSSAPPPETADGSEKGDKPGGSSKDKKRDKDKGKGDGGHPGRDDATVPVAVAPPAVDKQDPPPPPPPPLTYTLDLPDEPPGGGIRATDVYADTAELTDLGGGGGGGWGACEPRLGQSSEGAQTSRTDCRVPVPNPPMPGTPANAHPTRMTTPGSTPPHRNDPFPYNLCEDWSAFPIPWVRDNAPSGQPNQTSGPPPGSWLEPHYLDADVTPYNYGPNARYNLGLDTDPTRPVPPGVVVDDPGVQAYMNASGRVVLPAATGGPFSPFNPLLGQSYGGFTHAADALADTLPGGPHDLGYQGPGAFAGITTDGDWAKYYIAPGYRTYEPGKTNENILPGGFVVKDYVGIDLFDIKSGGISSNYGPFAPTSTQHCEGTGVFAGHGRQPPSMTNWGVRVPLNKYLALARVPIPEKLLALDAKVTPQINIQLSDGRQAQHLRLEIGAKPGFLSADATAAQLDPGLVKPVLAHSIVTMSGMPLADAEIIAERALKQTNILNDLKVEGSVKAVVQYDLVVEQSNNMEMQGIGGWVQPNIEIFTTVRVQPEVALKYNPSFLGWDKVKPWVGDFYKNGARAEVAFTTSTRFESPQAVYVPTPNNVYLPIVGNPPPSHEVYLPLVSNQETHEVYLPLVSNQQTHEVYLPLVTNGELPPVPPEEMPATMPVVSGEFDPDVESVHTVQAGETVWSIAADHLQTAWGRTPTDIELVDFSRSVIERNMSEERDPDLIAPGEIFVIPHAPPAPPAP